MKTIVAKLGLAAALLAVALPVSAGNITVTGSDTMVIIAQKWAEAYSSKHPQTKIQVNGGGSGVGFSELQKNGTDIANASRPIKAKEQADYVKAFNKLPREYKVALDGLSVYVHPSNPISELSIDQLEQIFTGKAKNWKDVGGKDAPIEVYSRENVSGTYEFFKEHVLKGRDFASSAKTMQGSAALLHAVSEDPKGIGYAGAAYGHGARVVKIKKTPESPAIEPSEENVVSGKYPLSRYLFNYLNPEKDKGEVAAYLNWIRGDEGQKLVKEMGFYPLPPNLREK